MELKQTHQILKDNLIYLIVIPILSAIFTFIFASIKPVLYSSSVTIYTGQSSAQNATSDIISMNFSQTNNDLDNVISFLNSGPIQEEIILRIFANHLYQYFNEQENIPEEHFDFIKSSVLEGDRLRFYDAISIDNTIKNLELAVSAKDSALKEIIFNPNSPYSISQFDELKVNKTASSDIIRVTFRGASELYSQQVLNEVTLSIKNSFELIQLSGIKKIEQFFKDKLEETEKNLQTAELDFANFKQKEDIIDFVEQAKTLVINKQDAFNAVSNAKTKMTAAEENLKEIEKKLEENSNLFSTNVAILEKKEALADLVRGITVDTIFNSKSNVLEIQKKIDSLKKEISQDVLKINNPKKEDLTRLPSPVWLDKWLESFIIFNTQEVIYNAAQKFYDDLNIEIESIAPLEIEFRRLQREITLNEATYIEILKAYQKSILRQQNQKLSNNFLVIESPEYNTIKEETNKLFTTIFGYIFGVFAVVSVLISKSYLMSTLRALND